MPFTPETSCLNIPCTVEPGVRRKRATIPVITEPAFRWIECHFILCFCAYGVNTIWRRSSDDQVSRDPKLKSLGISEREIATSCGVSRNTVARVCKRAAELNIQRPLEPSVTDKELQEQLFPREENTGSVKRLPDCEYIRKELLKNGVTAICGAGRS